MALFSKIGWWGKKAVDQAVGVTSGAVPVSVLDSPKVFRLVVALLIAAFGVSAGLVWNTISSATKTPTVQQNTNTTPIAELEKLRNRDTDEDGLSDYDELFALHTSPYLSDSDSDGVSDATEANQNQDPNCPKGKSCTGFAFTNTATDQNGQLTPQFLRQALLTSGVPQATIDQLNDTDLLRVYQDAIKDSNVSGNANTEPIPTLDSLNNLSPAEIRNLLLESGVDKTTLDKVDDTTLRQIFQQAINQQNTNQ